MPASEGPSEPLLIAVVGATGTGKSDLAIALADRYRSVGRDAEIVNADAMQLYRGMDIGTAKVPPDERHGIPHHQLDVLDVTDEASVAAYQREARRSVDAIIDAGRAAILVGGSGLYVSSVLFDMRFPGRDPVLRAALERELAADGPSGLLARLRAVDPVAADSIDGQNPRRVIRALEVALRSEPVKTQLPSAPVLWRPTRILHLRRERSELVDALHTRAARMFERGLLDEVERLRLRGLEQGRTARAAIGYAQALRARRGEISVPDAIESTAIATRQYARRQVSWFRRYRQAEDIQVTDAGEHSAAVLARRIVV